MFAAAEQVRPVAGLDAAGLLQPLFDRAVGIDADQGLLPVRERLEAAEWIYRGDAGANGGEQWRTYLLFRNLLRRDPSARAQYEFVQQQVSAEVGDDRATYTDRKSTIVSHLLHGADNSGDFGR